MRIHWNRLLLLATPWLVCAACSGEVSDSLETEASDAGASASPVERDAGAAAGGAGGGSSDPRGTAGSSVRAGRGAAGSQAPRDAGGVVDAGDARSEEPDSGPARDAGGEISEGPPEVRFVGRVDRSDPARVRFAWSGSGVVARFTGRSIGVRLGGGQEYTLLVDGALQPKLVPGNGMTMIDDALPDDGPHVIELYRRTEANQGEAQFLGLELAADGMLLPPTRAPARRLEIIGDSITCGYGNEGEDASCGFTPQTENHYMTYGAIAARALGAELSTVAWSGRGMVCNYGDEADSCVDPMPVFYDRTLPERPDSAWDFTSRPPHAVIINLGTNDYSTNDDPSEQAFTDGYRDFLLHVRSKYPDARILCTCGPLLWGDEHARVQRMIAAAVEATGDDAITTFEIPPQNTAEGVGCHSHPNIKTHEKMAALLVAELKARLGW